MWGFEAPLGAFIAAWGGVAMLTSAPFDNWWHSAYGLDVKILSPPHVFLILGNLAVNTGTLILILGMMNRARDEFREQAQLAVPVHRRRGPDRADADDHGILLARPDAQRRLLSRGVHGGAAGAGRSGARLREALGRHHGGLGLLAVLGGHGLDPAAVSR